MFRKQVLTGLALLCACTLSAWASTPAAAQYIRAGETVRGELTSSDPTLDDDSHYDIWRYRGRAGERLTITLRSSDFDAFLAFGQMTDGECQDECKTDDDGAGDTDARLVVNLTRDGEFHIRANSLSEGETGAYTLTVESGQAPQARVQDIRLGQTVSGQLDSGDATAGDDSYYEVWRFRGTPGQRITVTMRSSDFDAYLVWGRMSGGEWEELDNDDDGGGGTDARLQVTVDGAGEYLIRANTLSEGETGSYTLTVATESDFGGTGRAGAELPAEAPEPTAIRAGQTVSGRLGAGDPKMDDGSYYDQYSYEGRAGERLTITMRSGDFDTFLAFGTLSGTALDAIATNDDGPEGTDSQVEITLPRNGRYVIRANSLTGNATGAYTLVVRSAR